MKRRLLVLALGTFAIGTESFVIAGLLPELAEDLAVPLGRAGLLVSVFAVVYALSAPAMVGDRSADSPRLEVGSFYDLLDRCLLDGET